MLTILGDVLYRLGDRPEAEGILKRSLSLNSADDEAHFCLGMVLRDTRPDEAARHFRETLRLDSGFPKAQRELGFALFRLARYDEAEMALRSAIAAAPGDAWAHDYLGNLLKVQGQWDAAMMEFLAATQAEGSEPFFWCNLAECHSVLRHSGDADRLYRHALSLNTNDPMSNLRYGLFLVKVGKRKRAARYLRRTLELDPQEDRARRALLSLEAKP
jgi:tetratricopeptide (TPR) repeat protein